MLAEKSTFIQKNFSIEQPLETFQSTIHDQPVILTNILRGPWYCNEPGIFSENIFMETNLENIVLTVKNQIIFNPLA